jgi:hypothetical protein
MPAPRRYAKQICDCGGEVPRPRPVQCPHCGRLIVSVQRSPAAWLLPVAVVGGFFLLLLGGFFIILRLVSN